MDRMKIKEMVRERRPVLEILLACGGYYKCPRDAEGRRTGPLVAYAGRYSEKDLQYVGDEYANFAMAEEHPFVLDYFARELADRIHPGVTVLCAAPMGGLAFGAILALASERRFIYPEKEVVELATTTSRAKTRLVFDRHEVCVGDRIAIVEDVSNNFSTTGTLIDLITALGGNVSQLVSIMNRSSSVAGEFLWKSSSIPVTCMSREKLPQYHQDDPEVAEDIARGNVVWNPKKDWDRLEHAMAGKKTLV